MVKAVYGRWVIYGLLFGLMPGITWRPRPAASWPALRWNTLPAYHGKDRRRRLWQGLAVLVLLVVASFGMVWLSFHVNAFWIVCPHEDGPVHRTERNPVLRFSTPTFGSSIRTWWSPGGDRDSPAGARRWHKLSVLQGPLSVLTFWATCGKRVLELCCGNGCNGVLREAERRVFGVDISSRPFATRRRASQRHQGRLWFLHQFGLPALLP